MVLPIRNLKPVGLKSLVLKHARKEKVDISLECASFSACCYSSIMGNDRKGALSRHSAGFQLSCLAAIQSTQRCLEGNKSCWVAIATAQRGERHSNARSVDVFSIAGRHVAAMRSLTLSNFALKTSWLVLAQEVLQQEAGRRASSGFERGGWAAEIHSNERSSEGHEGTLGGSAP